MAITKSRVTRGVNFFFAALSSPSYLSKYCSILQVGAWISSSQINRKAVEHLASYSLHTNPGLFILLAVRWNALVSWDL